MMFEKLWKHYGEYTQDELLIANPNYKPVSCILEGLKQMYLLLVEAGTGVTK